MADKLVTLTGLKVFKNEMDKEINEKIDASKGSSSGGSGSSGGGSSVIIGDNKGEAFDGYKGKALENLIGLPIDIPGVIDINVTTVKQTTDANGEEIYLADTKSGVGSITQDYSKIPLPRVQYVEKSNGVEISLWRGVELTLSKVEILKANVVVATITGQEFEKIDNFDIVNASYRETFLIQGKTISDLMNNGTGLHIKSYDVVIDSIASAAKDIEESVATIVKTLGIPNKIDTDITVNITGAAQAADTDGIVKYVATGDANLVQSDNSIPIVRAEYWESSDKKVHLEIWRPYKTQVLGSVKVGVIGNEVDVHDFKGTGLLVEFDENVGAWKESMLIDTELSVIAPNPLNFNLFITGMKIDTILPSLLDMEKSIARFTSKSYATIYGMGTQAQADALTDDDGQEGDLFFVLDDATS